MAGLFAGFCVACSFGKADDPEATCSALDATIHEVVSRCNSLSLQVAVVHRDQIIWFRAYGENSSIDHVFMNASVQKVYDAVAVLQLVERELVDPNADVGKYVPFEVRHPGYPDVLITVRMILAHRSGLDAFTDQFSLDTKDAFFPRFRPACKPDLIVMSLEEYLQASLTPEGSNYDERAWISEPGRKFHYSVSTYPFLRFLLEQVTGQSYPEYMQRNVFGPLGMSNSGFSAYEFTGRNAIPYTRIDGKNIELPVWETATRCPSPKNRIRLLNSANPPHFLAHCDTNLWTWWTVWKV